MTWWRLQKSRAEQECGLCLFHSRILFPNNLWKEGQLLTSNWTTCWIIIWNSLWSPAAFTFCRWNIIHCKDKSNLQHLILYICKVIGGFVILECGMMVSTMIEWELRYLRQVFQSFYIPPEQKDIWTTLAAQIWIHRTEALSTTTEEKRLALHSETSWKAKAAHFIPQLFNPGLYLLYHCIYTPVYTHTLWHINCCVVYIRIYTFGIYV